VGAHNDHVGYNNRPVDHDSIKAFNDVFLLQGAESRPTPDQLKDAALWAKVNAKIATARALNPPRPDSIYNGADDDGSGSVTVLEIAEAFAAGKLKPKRSILFIWQTGEESGMWGSGWFADHPTVPRDSIVGAINMDMVGRGFATDVTGTTKEGAFMYGGPGYLQLVGSRRLSAEFGDLVETVNTEKKLGFKFDYNIDADGHPQNIYCRSDHWSYAKYGIPVVFFTTGGHADYHQLTDEPQYINYPHMADVSKLGLEVAMKVANLDHRVKMDKAGPFDPKARCRQ
jgi:Zn-dependent M28 family amino/carboxypeptidase